MDGQRKASEPSRSGSRLKRLIFGGARRSATAAAGCSTKSIQRCLALIGGLKRRVEQRSAATFVAWRARGAVAGPRRRRLAADDRDAAAEAPLDDLAIQTRGALAPSRGTGRAISSSVKAGRSAIGRLVERSSRWVVLLVLCRMAATPTGGGVDSTRPAAQSRDSRMAASQRAQRCRGRTATAPRSTGTARARATSSGSPAQGGRPAESSASAIGSASARVARARSMPPKISECTG